jgi:hypothetical protein
VNSLSISASGTLIYPTLTKATTVQGAAASTGGSAATVQSALPSAFTQSLNALGTLTGANDDPLATSLESTLLDNVFLSAAGSAQAAAALTSTAGSSTDATTSLLVQALSAENQNVASGEIPFTAPYQLGLLAALDVPAQVQAATPANQAASAASQATTNSPVAADLLQTLNAPETLLGAANGLPTLGTADPTASALFQSLLGSTASALIPAAPTAGLTETPADLRVAETFASAATSAFSENSPLNSNSLVLSAPRGAFNVTTGAGPAGGAIATYTPLGMGIAEIPQVGLTVNVEG